MKNRYTRIKVFEMEESERKSWLMEIIDRRREGMPHCPYKCGDQVIWKDY